MVEQAACKMESNDSERLYLIVLDSDPDSPMTSDGKHDVRSMLLENPDEAKQDADEAIEEGFMAASVYELSGLSVKLIYTANDR